MIYRQVRGKEEEKLGRGVERAINFLIIRSLNKYRVDSLPFPSPPPLSRPSSCFTASVCQSPFITNIPCSLINIRCEIKKKWHAGIYRAVAFMMKIYIDNVILRVYNTHTQDT